MATTKYVSALVMWGKRSAANLAWLEKQSCELIKQIGACGGGQLVSVAAPGQHVALNQPMTLQDQFAAINEAIEIINGRPAIVSSVYPVFW